ncbi:UDP-N-acetylglucosamine 2-epimerase (non-hydrolyzing) [Verrucomicrobia bacterium]|nr:UDP-N-acetylglucosamine 2-epimerase (non-hydrolyzing) [Verrucomicrobiota bacterium]
MKILTVIGARPQFIKAATVSRVIRKCSEIREIIVHTGQHFDSNMSQIFFEQLEIPKPQYNLGIASLTHGAMTGRMIEEIEKLLLKEVPDWVLIYGDTNSTIAATIASAKLQIPLAHVESGLRSHNLAMPEEINRICSDRLSSRLFCPTETAVSNLRDEGFPFNDTNGKKQEIFNVGDVMYDAALFYKLKAVSRFSLDNYGVSEKKYVLCTLHRAENTSDVKRLEAILSGLRKIAKDIPIILPIHPRTIQTLKGMKKIEWVNGLILLDPLSYLEMQRLEMSAKIIITDSGGVQKEAYFHRVPCLTIRDETEWGETIALGWNTLVKADDKKIYNAFIEQIEKKCIGKNQEVGSESKIFGEGNASQKIIDNLQR